MAYSRCCDLLKLKLKYYVVDYVKSGVDRLHQLDQQMPIRLKGFNEAYCFLVEASLIEALLELVVSSSLRFIIVLTPLRLGLLFPLPLSLSLLPLFQHHRLEIAASSAHRSSLLQHTAWRVHRIEVQLLCGSVPLMLVCYSTTSTL